MSRLEAVPFPFVGVGLRLLIRFEGASEGLSGSSTSGLRSRFTEFDREGVAIQLNGLERIDLRPPINPPREGSLPDRTSDDVEAEDVRPRRLTMVLEEGGAASPLIDDGREYGWGRELFCRVFALELDREGEP
jgi:hypothetical protein